MPGLNSTPQVERQQFSQPLITQGSAPCPLENVQIGRLVGLHYARAAVEQRNVPPNDYLVGKRVGMRTLHQLDQLWPARQFAFQDLRPCLEMLLIPSVPRRSPGAARAPSQLTSANVDVGCDATGVPVIHDRRLIVCHAKDRIGHFNTAPARYGRSLRATVASVPLARSIISL